MSDEKRYQMRRADDRIHERLATIEEKLNNLCEFLLDNGQPGAITKVNTRIDHVETAVNDLNGWRRGVHYIVLALSAVVTALAWAWEHLPWTHRHGT